MGPSSSKGAGHHSRPQADGSRSQVIVFSFFLEWKALTCLFRWNLNGNWLLTCSRDQLTKLFDIRTMKELQVFRGHRREVTCCQWHPFHEGLFMTGSGDGCINFYNVGGTEQPIAKVGTRKEKKKTKLTKKRLILHTINPSGILHGILLATRLLPFLTISCCDSGLAIVPEIDLMTSTICRPGRRPMSIPPNVCVRPAMLLSLEVSLRASKCRLLRPCFWPTHPRPSFLE